MNARIASFLLAGALPLACPAQAAEPPAVVKTKCAVCHGEKGETIGEDFPRLAGQHEAYLAKQLHDFQSGGRQGIMPRMVRGLSEADIAAVAAHFASQVAVPPAAPASELASSVGRYLFTKGNPYSGIPPCMACHGEKAQGTATLPRLAGQHAAYLERQIQEFSQRKRTNDNEIMHTIVERLTPLETRAVAEYLSSLP
jgi:cytochrome c553